MSAAPPPFHLAIPVNDLAAARSFYGGLLGCPEGRSSERWVDFDFFGHQLVAHRIEVASGIEAAHGVEVPNRTGGARPAGTNPVDGDQVPVPHFGAVLAWDDWHALAERLRSAGASFVIAPRVRFRGQAGEQATMFLLDPAGNALEFKAFRDPARLFARD